MESIVPSNADILNRQSQAKAAKKKARQGRVEEVVFNDAARRSYLTGFHKRKMEREAVAKRKAIAREKAEKIAERKEASYMYAPRKQELVERAKKNRLETERAYGNDALDDEFDPLQVQSLAKGKAKEDQVEFQDEEVTATVTVVEEFDVDELINGPKPQTPSIASDPSHSRSLSPPPLSPSQPPPLEQPRRMAELMKKPEGHRKTISYETGAEKRDRLIQERKKRLKLAEEAKTRKKPKKKKDDGGRKRPSLRRK